MKAPRSLLLAVLALGLTLAACGEDQETEPAPAGMVTLRFAVNRTVRESPNLKDPLLGTARGALFHSEEVTVTGPNDGAESVDDLTVEGVDLQAEIEASEASWTSVPLPPGKYKFLGFFDLDDNGAETGEPDSGDPVTLPIDEFEILDGQTIEALATFNLVI